MLSPTLLLIVVGVTLSGVLVLGAVVGSLVYELRFSPRARLRRRVAAIINPEGAFVGEQGAKGGNPRRRGIQAKLKELEDAKKKSRRRREIRQQIQEAGLDIPIGQFYFLSLVVGVAAAGIYMLAMGFDPRNLTRNLIIAALIAPPAGFFVPKLALGILGSRRKNKFITQFADAVDVIVRGIQTGLPIGECLTLIGRESPDPVGTEFRLITEGQRIGLTLEDALTRATDRMPVAELRFFAIVLYIQQQTGGNLAETLGNLSRVLRERKKMDDKVKAMSSEARSTAMIIGSLPFIIGLLLFAVNPEYILLLFETTAGNILLGVGAFLLSMGALIMKGMMNFKV